MFSITKTASVASSHHYMKLTYVYSICITTALADLSAWNTNKGRWQLC